MIIHSLRKSRESNGTQSLSAVVTFETPVPCSFQAYFAAEHSPGELSESADPFLIQMLIPAMLLGESLRVVGPVDPELIAAIEGSIKPLLLRWFPFLKNIPVRADRLVSPPPRMDISLAAIAFSGGLDSVYTTAKHRDELGLLVVTQGLNVRSWQSVYWRKVLPGIRAAAAVFAKPVMTVRTNIMEISHYQTLRTRRGRVDPEYYKLGGMGQLGSYLAAIGRTLDPFCSRFLLSAGVAYENLVPFGSHPLLDPLWSTTRQEIVHDGCEATRIEKVAYLAEHHPEALARIHVCLWSTGPNINCSRCEKCLRTMTEIRTCGAESLAHSFCWPLDMDHIRAIKVRPRTVGYWRRLLDRAVERGDTELAGAIRAALPRTSGLDRLWAGLHPWKRKRRLARERWNRIRTVINPPSRKATGEIRTDPKWLTDPPAMGPPPLPSPNDPTGGPGPTLESKPESPAPA